MKRWVFCLVRRYFSRSVFWYFSQIDLLDIMRYKLARRPMNEIHRLVGRNVLQTRSEERFDGNLNMFQHVV